MVTRIREWPGGREVIRGNLPALHVANCFRAKVGGVAIGLCHGGAVVELWARGISVHEADGLIASGSECDEQVLLSSHVGALGARRRPLIRAGR